MENASQQGVMWTTFTTKSGEDRVLGLKYLGIGQCSLCAQVLYGTVNALGLTSSAHRRLKMVKHLCLIINTGRGELGDEGLFANIEMTSLLCEGSGYL